jgi:hypothetical protein
VQIAAPGGAGPGDRRRLPARGSIRHTSSLPGFARTAPRGLELARAFDPRAGCRPTVLNQHPRKATHVKPTPKQLAYLKSLAEQTATTFTYPTTSAQASAEIRRLKSRPRSGPRERVRERRDVQRDLAERPDDAAAVRIGRDVRGYGSSARWAHTPDGAVRS